MWEGESKIGDLRGRNRGRIRGEGRKGRGRRKKCVLGLEECPATHIQKKKSSLKKMNREERKPTQ